MIGRQKCVVRIVNTVSQSTLVQISTLIIDSRRYLEKGPSMNDVSSKGEGGGSKTVGIYLVKWRQRGREVIKSEKWADVVSG